MPELPEVETVKNSLKNNIIGKKILNCQKFRNSLRYKLDEELATKTKNTYINEISRVAKYIIIELSNGYLLIFHLGMSGRITFQQKGYNFKKHDHLAFLLDDKYYLVFNDTRRFGMVYICQNSRLKSQKYMQNMGPEPFEQSFNAKYLLHYFKHKNISIKSALMNNKIVVGVGNIYAAESLFLSNIHPLTKVKNLTEKELDKLVNSIILVLEEAIKAGGTTLRDFVNGDNKPGYFKQNLNVYGRMGQDCKICKYKISKIIQHGRATYFCQKCQDNI